MAEQEKPEDEAKEAGGEDSGLNPPPKSGKKKMLLIGAVAGVLVLGGAGAGLFFSGVLGGGHSAAPAGEATEATKAEAPEAGKTEPAAEGGEGLGKPVFFSLGDILVNLTGDGKRPNFLKIKVSLELVSEKDSKDLEQLKPRIVDNFQVYLRELRVEDLRGSAGLYRLREELLLRVTEAVKPIRVKDVLFEEMLVQ